MCTNPYIFEGLISRGAFWRAPQRPPWGHHVRIALCFSPAGRASASGLLWAQKRASRLLVPPPWPLRTARGALKTAFARRVIAPPQSTPKAVKAASAPNPPVSRAPNGYHRRANCGPAVERAAIGALAKGMGARCTALCRSARRRPRRGRCSVPAEGYGGVLLRPRCGRRSVEGHGGVLVRPRCGRCSVPAEGHGAWGRAAAPSLLAAAGALWPQERVGRNTGNHRGGSSEGTKRKRAAVRAAAVAEHEWQRRRRPLHKAGGG